MTRLADITGLDRIGLPVWQAIRPASRALSVHQGKAFDEAGAQIGALCEAIESHCAEQVEADGPLCGYASLPDGERAGELGDLLADRAGSPSGDEPMHWCEAADLATGRRIWLPHALVSLDFRIGSRSLIERSSNGLGAGPDQVHALANALLELIERDALACWSRMSWLGRVATRLESDSIPFHWFRHWRDRLAALNMRIDIFDLPSLAGLPAFRCVIEGGAAFGPGLRTFSGSAAHGDAETALAKALAEAAQTRLTLIAGSRDDLLFDHYQSNGRSATEPEDWPPGRPWSAPEPVTDVIGWTVERLAERGYRQVAVKRLDRELDGVAVVKAFVPGLGLLARTRRVPT